MPLFILITLYNSPFKDWHPFIGLHRLVLFAPLTLFLLFHLFMVYFLVSEYICVLCVFFFLSFGCSIKEIIFCENERVSWRPIYCYSNHIWVFHIFSIREIIAALKLDEFHSSHSFLNC